VTLPLVARYADEWNSGGRTPEDFSEISSYLDSLLDKAGRPRNSVKRSMMIFLRFGRTEAELQARLAAQPIPERMSAATLAATPEGLRDHLSALRAAGLQRAILNWRDDYDDVDSMRAVAEAVTSLS
jgi:alkanesulfonate monooxygenase SsuD/methylene tetrahydromethanopterin reductase-like flavin-dependent oxidoreductase (luciferase family)